jgi:hypothetical protein
MKSRSLKIYFYDFLWFSMIPVLKLDDVGCNAAIPFKLRISAKSSRALSHWSACDKSRTDVFGVLAGRLPLKVVWRNRIQQTFSLKHLIKHLKLKILRDSKSLKMSKVTSWRFVNFITRGVLFGSVGAGPDRPFHRHWWPRRVAASSEHGDCHFVPKKKKQAVNNSCRTYIYYNPIASYNPKKICKS